MEQSRITKSTVYQKLLIAIVSVIVVFVVVEVAMICSLKYAKKDRQIFLPSRLMGHVHAPNNTFYHKFSDGKVRNHVNAFGFVGEEINKKKSPDTYRIVILGDSLTEAFQVPYQQNYSYLLGQQLNQLKIRAYKNIEVINAGVSGYSPVSEWQYFRKFVKDFEPNLILLQLSGNSVFQDNKTKAMSVFDEEGKPLLLSRFFVKDLESGKVGAIPDKLTILERIHGWLIEKSRFYEYIAISIHKSQKNKYHRKRCELPEFDDKNQFFAIDPNNALFKDTTFYERLFTQTKGYLQSFATEAIDAKAQLIIFFIPNEGQLNLTEHIPATKEYTSTSFSNDLNVKLDNFCATEHLAFFDLLPAFERNKLQEIYYPHDGHLTRLGHELVASQLAAYLIKHDVLK